MHSFGCGCALPIQLDFRVVRGAQDGNKHTDTVEWCHRDIEEYNAKEYGEALFQVAANRDGESACDLVRLERNNVERERHHAVADDGEEERVVENAFCDRNFEASELAARVSVKQALRCGERRHAEEDLHSGQRKRSSHEAVGCDGLDSCQNHTERREQEADHSEIVVTKCSQCDTEDERNHRDVGIAGV
jgi:SLT domain-containing protein